MKTKLTILLTGGRAPATLDMCRYLHRLGHRVLVAESQAQHLCLTSRAVARAFAVTAPNQDLARFVADLEEIIRAEKVDLLIPTCEEVFAISRGLPTLSQATRVLGDSIDVLDRLHNKWEFNQRATAHGLGVPKSQVASSMDELTQLAGSRRPLVIKPAYSRFASKTLILHEGDPLPLLADIRPSYPYVIQEFMAGQEYCTYGVCQSGELLAHAIYSHDFTAGKGAGICFEAIEKPAILAWVREFVKREKFTGQIAFDFIESAPGQVCALECNPRTTSGVHLFAPDDRLDLRWLGQSTEFVQPKPGSLGRIGLAMWLYGLPSVRTWSTLANWIRIMLRAREVVFDFADPLPFFHQFYCYFSFWRQSVRLGIPILEASTHDIEWNGNRKAE
ncbi:MAG: carbamoylphosphate synthase large subunit [Bacteriovoracia bacterium]